jgi:hypothetical protein
VKPDDLVTFAAAGVLSLLMTLAGSLPPALRAVRVDPPLHSVPIELQRRDYAQSIETNGT